MAQTARIVPLVELSGVEARRRRARTRPRRIVPSSGVETGRVPLETPPQRIAGIELPTAAHRRPAAAGWAAFREGAQEVLVTLLATLAFGLTWAAIEAGRANSALARDGFPTAVGAELGWRSGIEAPIDSAERPDPASLGETRYARVLIDGR